MCSPLPKGLPDSIVTIRQHGVQGQVLAITSKHWMVLTPCEYLQQIFSKVNFFSPTVRSGHSSPFLFAGRTASPRTPFLRIRDSRDRYFGRGKYERAVEIAARFPEIGWKLPPKRKAWESEDYRMSMFSAAALAMTYRSLRYGTVTSPPGGVMPKFTQSSKS